MSAVTELDLRAGDGQPNLPANLDAELAVLGCVLYDNDAAHRCEGLQAEHFFEAVHGRLWAIIAEIISRPGLAEPIIVADRMQADPAFVALGGLGFLADMVDRAPPTNAAGDLAKLIMDTAQRRDLLALGGNLAQWARDPEAPIADVQQAVEDALLGMGRVQARARVVGAAEAAADVLAYLDAPEATGGVLTGIAGLDDRLGTLQGGDLVLIAGRPGMGKAQPLHSPILLADGTWTTMGEIATGAELASIDGAGSGVVAVHERGDREVFRVMLSDGRATEVCADHLWRVTSRHWSAPRVINTAEIVRLLQTTRHKGRLSIDLVSGDFGSSTSLPVDPYLLGAILGDGSTRSANVRLTTADPEMVEEIARRLPPGMIIKRVVGSYAYSLRGEKRNQGKSPLALALEGIGLMGVRGECKSIPPVYLTAGRAARLELLQGLLDTDGWAEKEGAVRFCSTSQALARDVAYLVRSLGGLAAIREKQPTCYVGGEKRAGATAYTVKIRHPHGETLFKLSRKADRARRGRNASVRLNIVSVLPVGTAPTRCITVSHPSALYVTDDFTVTHNSALGATVALNAAKAGVGVIEINSEMTTAQMMRRHLTDLCFDRHGSASPFYKDIRRRQISPAQRRMLEQAAQDISAMPLAMVKRTGLTLSSARSLIRRQRAAWAQQGITLGLVTIDHVGLLSADGGGRDRYSDQTAIAIGSKQLADDLGIPVIALVQLNRQVEQRDNKRPTLADLRDSGAWEENADTVIGVFREAYYANKEPEPKAGASGSATELKWDEWDRKRKSRAIDAMLLKVREGEEGVATLWASIGHNAIRSSDPNDNGGMF